jgi:hypothetical protein
MHNSWQRIGELDQRKLSARGRKPNCPPLGNGSVEDSAALALND